MASNFRAGGLASGIDTSSIIDALIALQRKPIEKMAAAQKLVDVKVSALGALSSKLRAFESAVTALAQNGARGLSIAQSPPSIGAAITSGAEAGSYSLEVSALAQAAKVRATPFASTALVRGGSLHIDADGTGYDVTLADGATLEEAAAAVRGSGAPVTVSIVDDGTSKHLVLTRSTSGHAVGTAPETALAVTETSTGSLGAPLGFTNVVTASNARMKIDGLAVERRTNEIAGVLPGTTLTLKQVTTTQETLVVANDGNATKAALQKVIDSYNAVLGDVQSELAVGADTARSKTLAGEPTLRSVQARMQSLLVNEIGTGAVRTLADLGVRSARDGKLTIDAATFDKAIAAAPGAVDALFDGGLAAAASTIVDAFADTLDGAITIRSKSLVAEKKRLEEQKAILEARAERQKDLLIARFTTMESIVSSLKATGSFLTSQSSAKEK